MNQTHRKLIVLAVSLVVFSANSFAGENDWGEWDDNWDEPSGLNITGFTELGYGSFINSDNQTDSPLNEWRTQLDWSDSFEEIRVNLTADINIDQITNDNDFEFRNVNFQKTLGDHWDIKIGRQVLTWGVGDLAFINDLFPKDWQSFFNGRDDEYLKAPSDSIKLSFFSSVVNMDLVYNPEFTADNYLNGERLSFYIPGFGITQPSPVFSAETPNKSESAIRLFKKIDGTEWALYGYNGFYKTPEGLDADRGVFHPELYVFGASIRTSLGAGLFGFELGEYKTNETFTNSTLSLPNDQIKVLINYEWELFTNVTSMLQWFSEKKQSFTSSSNVLGNELAPKATYHQVSLRLTQLALQQRLTNSLFLFYSPTEEDWHLRIKTDYRLDDDWRITAGIYLYDGKYVNTFLGQLQENDSLWVRVRYNF